jgi:pilus assembly protein CpaC
MTRHINRTTNAIAKATATPRGNSMKRRLILSLAAAACAGSPLALASAGTAHAQSIMRPANDVVLSIGRGQLVNVPGNMTDVFVANENIADVQVKSQRQLYVFGKAGGETTVYANNAAGQVIWSATVRVGSNIESVDQMLNLAMPDAKITVSTMGTGTFLLTGIIATPEDAAEAQRLVQAYVGKQANVITRLKTATPLQVNLQVRFAEVSRSLVRDIGVNLLTRDQTGGMIFGVSRGGAGTITGGDISGSQVMMDPCAFYRLACTTTPVPFDPIKGAFVTQGTAYGFTAKQAIGTTLGIAGKALGLDLLSTLELGERVGLVTTLSSPNLTALSGETADFLAGGEFPVPTSQGLGSTSIEYRKFGVSLAYTPTVLANGRISLRVRPEVSELSSQGAVVLNGFQVPSLTIRRAETTIELGSGQSFMIAGLMSNNAQRTLEKAPGVGDIPILGSLFRSTNFRKGETELVIVVTPYLVNPVNAEDIKLPTDGYQSPNMLKDLLGNMEHDGKSGTARPGPTAGPDQAPNPSVSLQQPAIAPPSRREDDKPRKSRRSAAANVPAPGFNLK